MVWFYEGEKSVNGIVFTLVVEGVGGGAGMSTVGPQDCGSRVC